MEATASGRNEISSEIEISATSAALAKGELAKEVNAIIGNPATLQNFQPSALYLCFFPVCEITKAQSSLVNFAACIC